MQRPASSACLIVSVLLVGVAASALAACSRTPPEPAPASSTNNPPTLAAATGDVTPRNAAVTTANAATSTASAPSATNRCITATPAVAPPMPTVASRDACPPDPEGIPKLKTANVAFPEATGNPKVEVELVSSEKDVQRGLMYRMSMPEEHGMLFRLGERTDHTFWMHNTCMPLDMLFVEDDGLVVGIVEGAAPLTDSTRSVGCPSSWVLEVNAGWCRRHGVKAGQKMGIPAAAR